MSYAKQVQKLSFPVYYLIAFLIMPMTLEDARTHEIHTHLFKTHSFDKTMFPIKVEVFFKTSDK